MSTSDELDEQIKAERQRELMEGTGVQARRARYEARTRNRKADHCPEGHPYDEKNTYMKSSGRRMCLKCQASRRIHPTTTSSSRQYSKGKPVIDLTDHFNETRNTEEN